MEKRWTWLALLLVALVAFAGCSDDDDPIVPVHVDTAFEVLAAAGADYINDAADCPGVVSASTIQGQESGYTIIDIRAESAYLDGHIPGSFHSSLVTLVDDLLTLPTDKPYLLVCYSGQSAGHAKIAMELLGYDDVKSIGFGMCGWSTETNGSWEGNYGDNLVGAPETANNSDDLTTHTWPVLEDLGYAAGSVVVERVKDTLAENFKSIKYINSTSPADQLMGHEDEYFIINYFGLDDYTGANILTTGVPGHIEGAFQFTPNGSLGIDQMLENVPTDMPVVVYCWTGQHSSQITFYLNMLGYEAYSLSFGSNGLFHSDLLAHKWTVGGPAVDGSLVDEPTPLPAFEALFDEAAAYFNGGGAWYKTASVLDAELTVDANAYTILDVRSAEVFAAGHIQNAINVAVSDIPAQIGDGTIPVDLPFVVTCYTGQSAGYATAYLNLMGYTSFSLKFGMSSWHSTLTTKWDSAVALSPQVDTPETTNNNGDLELNMFPVLDDYSIEARMAASMAEGLQGKAFATDVDGYLDDWFIVNYWGEADYLGYPTVGARAPGHIPGAYQFSPTTSLDLETMLANLPSKLEDDPILVYCWTGQTSAQITMFLRMLGYDAYSLYYGANTLFYGDLDASQWVTTSTDRDLYDNTGTLITFE
jgi:rhodanese-related sulfurtransferase